MTEPTEPEIAAICDRMAQPLSREQIVANELQAHIKTANRPTSRWTNGDWIALARHIIQVVEVARNISAADVAKAMNSPPRVPLPTLDEFGD